MATRRDLLRAFSALAALSAVRGVAAADERAARSLRILVLGGTGFIGPHQVEYALSRGHRVTLFNRGTHKRDRVSDRVEWLSGDRDAHKPPGLDALKGDRRWDVVIDNSGYLPRHVRDSVDLLGKRVSRYVYVSTVAVYDASKGRSFVEDSPLRPGPGPDIEQVTPETYGPLKAECDHLVRSMLGARATVVRPGFIFGPGDETDRFTYWVNRIAEGGEVLGPPNPQGELQWVDARDLCPWIITLAERDQAGVFNAAGPREVTTWRQVLTELMRLSTTPVQVRWATEPVLEQAQVKLPLAWPSFFGGTDTPHFASAAAQAAGLRYRPLSETASATLQWWRAQPAERRASPRNWPSPEQERAALHLLARDPVAADRRAQPESARRS